ncbi:MAG TPA: FAD-dependent oxidoreductase [Fimbriimonadaceae bacterium]|nr:FAD-dependent oxidoreductase [Fimbriimonadaceae bacterium]
MAESSCDILIVGGGVGGVAAALAACSLGHRVVLTEETDWIGGQLTAQAVPPDEHPWIEEFGCTARYRDYRNGVRQYYRDHTPLHPQAPDFNPGGGWVSRLCHEPRIGWQVLNEMIEPAVAAGYLEVRLGIEPVHGLVDGDEVMGVAFSNGDTMYARYVLDATELGDLLPLCGAEYVTGAESKSETGEPNAVEGPAQPGNVQGLTWVMALAHDAGSHRVIDKPPHYEKWRAYRPEFWPGPLLGFDILDPHTGNPKKLPLFSDDWYNLFLYRQIVDPAKFEADFAPHPVTIVNWPQNDYFLGNLIDEPVSTVRERLEESRELSRSLLYWLQTEAPRHDGGVGYPGLYLRPDITGTPDGFAMAPYIREARRIKARFTVTEQMVAAYTNPGLDRAPAFSDSVGIGAYRIDLHPSTSGANTIDTSTLPFQIPLGALIPVRMKNLIPACKNIGTTHITNGCYRLHPVEWNIGEAAGLLASYCLATGKSMDEVHTHPAEYQRLLQDQGIELRWPATQLRAL